LEFISSDSEQSDFAAKVPYENYSEEFYEWWFEDWNSDDRLFKRAFNLEEMGLLIDFSDLWKKQESKFCHNMSIKELLQNPEWRQVMAVAKSILQVIGNAT
jgi:hypothetical protein